MRINLPHTHGLNDAFSAFADEKCLTDSFRIVTSVIIVVIAGLYGAYLLKEKQKYKTDSVHNKKTATDGNRKSE